MSWPFRVRPKWLSRQLGLAMAVLVCLPAAGVTFRFASASNRIYVAGPGGVTLTEIKAALPDAPLSLLEATGRVWYLGASLILEDGAQLKLYGPAYGGDVAELRLRSENTAAPDAIVELRADWGWLDIRGVRITSWDSAAQGPDTEFEVYGRAFIRARSSLDVDGTTALESRMDVIESDIGYLGFADAESYGLTWKVVDTTATNLPAGGDLFALVNVYGDILNSRLHHNYFGMYSYGHEGGYWAGNEVDHNVVYGMDPHDDSDNLRIEHNDLHHNGWHGLIASKRCDHLTIRTNRAWANGKNGIMLHRQSNDCLVEGNLGYQNGDSGIAIYDSDRAVIRGNVLLSNTVASIRLSVSADDNRIESNEMGFSGRISLYEGNDPPESGDPDPLLTGRCRRNIFTNNFVHDYVGEAVKVSGGDDNVFAGNVFAAGSAVLRFEGSTNNLVADNALPPGTLVRCVGSPTRPTVTRLRGQTGIILQLDAYSAAAFEGTGVVFDFGRTNVATEVTSEGSVASATLAALGGSVTVLARKLGVEFTTGAVRIAPGNWNLAGGHNKAWHTQLVGGIFPVGFRVGECAPGKPYVVSLNTLENVLGVFTADAGGTVSFSVSAPASSSYTVILREAGPALVLPSIPPQQAWELTPLTVVNTAIQTISGTTLSYSLSDAPAGMAIDGDGVITWIPTSAQSPGSYSVTTVANATPVPGSGAPSASATNQFLVSVSRMQLTIEATSTNTAILSWPAPAPGWVVQQSANPDNAAEWSNMIPAIEILGNQNQAVIPADSGRRFFRLSHP